MRVICEVFSEFAAKEDLNSLLIRVGVFNESTR